MPRQSAPPAPPPEPFWQLPAFRWGVAAVCLLAATAGMIWLEKLNRSYQIERRLEEDARLGPMVRKLKEQIRHAGETGDLKTPERAARLQIPQALWLGRIAPPRQDEPQDGSIIVLSDAHLLAGSPGPRDRSGQEVRIGRRNFVFPGARPRPGETWLISVWREGPGNVVHSAARYAAAPSASISGPGAATTAATR